MNSTDVKRKKLVIAISSRARFDHAESHAAFESEAVNVYCDYQTSREEEPLAQGIAFNIVKKLLALNNCNPKEPNLKVILLSRINADNSLRVFNSIKLFSMNISRAAFTRGKSTFTYASAFGEHLFLSAEVGYVRKTLNSGFVAATILLSKVRTKIVTARSRTAHESDTRTLRDWSIRIDEAIFLGGFDKCPFLKTVDADI